MYYPQVPHDTVKDLSSADIIKEIKQFADEERSSRIVLLVVTSHGNEKDDILCSDGSICKVQDILDALNINTDQPKVSCSHRYDRTDTS